MINYSIKSVLNLPQTTAFPYGCFTEKTVSGHNACLPGKKYGNPFIFKSLCPDCKRVRMDGIETYCLTTLLTKHNYWKPSLFRLVSVSLILISFWAFLGFSLYQGLRMFLPQDLQNAMLTKLNVALLQKDSGIVEAISDKDRKKSIEFFNKANVYLKKGKIQEAILEYRNSIKNNPMNSESFLGLGTCFLKLNRDFEAIDAFKQGVQLNDRDWKAQKQLSILYAKYGDFQKAADHANTLLQIRPDNADANLVLAATLHNQNHPDAALGHIKEAKKHLAHSPEEYSVDTYLFAAQVCYQMKEYDISESFYRQALALQGNLVDARVGLATLYAKTHKFELAEAELASVMAQDPKNIQALACSAEINILQGNIQQALKTYDNASEIAPENTKISIRQAELLIGIGQSNDGYKKLQQILKHNPKHIKALIVLANMYIGKKLYAQAIDHAQAVLALDSNNIQGNILLIKAFLGQKDYEEANTIIEAMRKIYPQNFDLTLLSAITHQQLDKRPSAISLFHEAAEIKPNSVTPHINLGGLYYEKHEMEHAISSYEKVLELSPGHPLASNNLAMLLLKSEDGVDRAFTLAKELKERYPENPFIDDTLGWAYYHMGEYEKAEMFLNLASTKRPNSPTIRFHLAKTMWKMGNKKKSRQALVDALTISTEFPDADEAKKLLNEIEKSLE